MQSPVSQIVDFDGAWSSHVVETDRTLDCRAWGPKLRYCTPTAVIRSFFEDVRGQLTPFTLYGSGDFHHLTALWLRQISQPFVLVSFDNHPDWSTLPPRWSCGSWISRALESSLLRRVAIWGCANFELNPPHRWFANHRALRSGRLEAWPWIERFGASARRRWSGINARNWKAKFAAFTAKLGGPDVYVTVDMDCLRPETAVTDWEQGLFTPEDIVWALTKLRESATIVGGDVCGVHSPADYVRWTQRFIARIDHPKKEAPNLAEARVVNSQAVTAIWPALTGS
jgi:Arginase family